MCPIVAPSTPPSKNGWGIFYKILRHFLDGFSEPVIFYRQWDCSGSPSNSDGDIIPWEPKPAEILGFEKYPSFSDKTRAIKTHSESTG